VLIIGSNEATTRLAELLAYTDTSGFSVRAIVSNKSIVPKGFKGKHFSSVSDALKSIDKLGIDTIIQTVFYESAEKNLQILDTARNKHLAFKFVPAQSEFYTGKNTLELFHEYPVISVHQTPLIGWGRIVKRLMDFFLSLALFIILLPVFLLTIIAIIIFDFGPVFFRQQRMTRWGNETKVLKFRTMKRKYSGRSPEIVFREMGRPELIKEYNENRAKVKNDPRISKLGKFLRASSIDELPQLLNVMHGDISLVGPRTIPKGELERDFREKSPLILSVKTGVTGLAQVSGRSDLTLDERIKLDSYYVQNWSVWLDIKILIKTIFAVFTNRGAQ